MRFLFIQAIRAAVEKRIGIYASKKPCSVLPAAQSKELSSETYSDEARIFNLNHRKEEHQGKPE